MLISLAFLKPKNSKSFLIIKGNFENTVLCDSYTMKRLKKLIE